MRLYMGRTILLLPELVRVHERLSRRPRLVRVGERDALGDGGMRVAQDVHHDVRPGYAEVLLLQRDEGFARGAVVARDLEPEAIGLVLEVARERVEQRLRDEEDDAGHERDEGPRRHVVEAIEAETRLVALDEAAAEAMRGVERQQDKRGEHEDNLLPVV